MDITNGMRELCRAVALAACTRRMQTSTQRSTTYEWLGMRRGLLAAWYDYWPRAVEVRDGDGE